MLKVRPGRILLTVIDAFIVFDKKLEVSACVTVSVAVPAPIISKILLLAPTIVATVDGLTEKVYAPLLFDEGRS